MTDRSTFGADSTPPALTTVDAAVPMYLQLEYDLHSRITSGEWAPGSLMPSEGELCELYGVSRITIRHALQRLVDRGVIVRRQGRGSYVRHSELSAGTRSVRSFTAEMLDLGMRPTSRLLSFSELDSPANVSSALGLAKGASVYRIHRVRIGDGEPIGVQTAFLRADRFPDLLAVSLEGQSLYSVLRNRYGIVPEEARETFRVGQTSAEDSRLLDVPPRSPAFLVERITYANSMAFEYVASVMRGDRYKVTVAIRNP